MAELNINFMSNEKFNSLEEIDEKSLFIINDTRIHNDLDETINGVKTFNDEIYAPNQVDYSRITNCITEIPQDIKLELVDGVLTLKAGSKVYIPNGVGVFDELVVNADKTITGFNSAANNTKFLLFINSKNQGLHCFRIQNCYSGGTAPTATVANTIWYDTSNNIIQNSPDQGLTWENVWGLPLAIITASNKVVTSIDQVFNGFGYIGSTFYGLPGVKGFNPNGFENGAYANRERRLGYVAIYTNTNANVVSVPAFVFNDTQVIRWSGGYEEVDELPDEATAVAFKGYYVKPENKIYRYNGSVWSQDGSVFAGYLTMDSTAPYNITSLQPKLPFRAVDYNDFVEVKEEITNIENEVETKQDIATAINYNNVTNCITHIPQDIKLELVDGTLTLKAGSKVYVPNGVGVFDEVTITQDILYPSLEHATATERVVFLSTGKTLAGFTMTNISSETTQPNSSNIQIWYDTTNNLVKLTNDSGATWISGLSLPICIGNYVNQVGFTSIDQVFNGFGYIGTELFCLPGVKALIPDGRNINGSLKNRLVTTTEVSTLTANGIGIRYTTLANNGKLYGNYNNLYYSDERNIYTNQAGSVHNGYMQAIQYVITNGVITEFNPKLPFRAVDYNDLSDLISQSSSMPTITYWED